MTALSELMPGDVVDLAGETATLIARIVPHPIWPNLVLAIWHVPGDVGWSLDALLPGQDIGEVRPSTPEARTQQLREVLVPGYFRG